MKNLLKTLILLASFALPAAVLAQAFPAKALRMVVPYPPGGGTDTLGRITAERIADRLGVPVVVANQPGGSGTVGSDQVRRADPDGYTLLFNASLFILGKNVVKSTPYDPLEDFSPLGRVGQAPLALVVSTKVEATTLAELVKAVRANPAAYNVAISGMGAAGHLGTLEFMRLAGVNLQSVPYKGTAPALADVMSGNVQILVDAATVLMPQTKGGRVRGIAIMSSARSKVNLDVPTTAEAGMPDLAMASWYGVWGPKGLPAPVATRIATAIAEGVKQPEFAARIESAGIIPGYMDPAAFAEFIRADQARAVALLKSANFQPE
ncbi:MAG: tripartite tricarboxylate transporter substrate binding protein [Betaproteobacteria bacterium]|nr:tripartite tricarboxylate transporter substrate binding protein [Betaproteobacteria bacterium]